jgi:hypothetical protein
VMISVEKTEGIIRGMTRVRHTMAPGNRDRR